MNKSELLNTIEIINNNRSVFLKRINKKTSFLPFFILIFAFLIFSLFIFFIGAALFAAGVIGDFSSLTSTLLYRLGNFTFILVLVYFFISPIIYLVVSRKKLKLEETNYIYLLNKAVFDYYQSSHKQIELLILNRFKELSISSFSNYKHIKPVNDFNKKMLAWTSDNKFCFAIPSLVFFLNLSHLSYEKVFEEFNSIPSDFDGWLNETINSIGFIDLNNLIYWRVVGDKSEWVDVSGGGSKGGISFGGALIGDLIAGQAGMILGGIKNLEVESIKSTRKVEDNRKIAFYFYENNVLKDIYFSLEDETSFRLLLPHKEYGSQMLNQKSSLHSKDTTSSSINQFEEKILKLQDLFSKNLISKEEFEKKKAEIISSI